MKQYYKVLGLPTNATFDEVKNARNSLLKKYHPDCYKGSISFAEEKTREINCVKHIDKHKRKVRQ